MNIFDGLCINIRGSEVDSQTYLRTYLATNIKERLDWKHLLFGINWAQ